MTSPPHRLLFVLIAVMLLPGRPAIHAADPAPANARKPANDAELQYWLQNMVWYHRFTPAEVTEATALSETEVTAALRRFGITPQTKPPRTPGAALTVLPYPGGRHPRIGFLDGAVRPQRETKISVFAPWDDTSYAVVDVPEAIWSNLGLIYLAHTHVPTVWTKQNKELAPLEWNRRADGTLDIERKLPNGITFGARIWPATDAVRMELWLTNGTAEKLSDLRVQNCVMLRGMKGFERQTNENKVFASPYVACRSDDGNRWVITAWEPCHRPWANPPCPCLHSDPKFPDCAPGETKRLVGLLTFYQGADLQAEFRRLDDAGWRKQVQPNATRLRGEILDAENGRPLSARVYLRGADGTWYFPRSESPDGSAVTYRKQRPDHPASVEMHTTLSAHPFVVDVPPGRYTLTAERGKEYHPESVTVTVGREPAAVAVKLRRWIDMAKLGWYSGETHVHRTPEELPTLMRAEDLNVAFPLLHWVTEAFTAPRRTQAGPFGDFDPKPVAVDPTHVWYPRNTEYEIFSVGKQRHTLGAFFVLNHRAVLDLGVPPVGPVGDRARREGGLIEMDKHNWPWSMALVPVLKPDLYELANNHVWRTEFGFPAFGEAAPEYMKVERTALGFTESGWLEYGFRNYYALLNCGFRLRPTAGTASGVHPVPLGFGRVYVHLPAGFSYDGWVQGLKDGRSFVSTGPMLMVHVNGQPPGHLFRTGPADFRVHGTAIGGNPLDRIEIVVNGDAVRTLAPANRAAGSAFETAIDTTVRIDGSSWLAVRCYEKRPDGRIRFAHTGPTFVEVPGKPLRPRRPEVAFLIKRVEEQIARSATVLPREALREYEEALRVFRERAQSAD